jgi:hypothetical protein
VPQRLRDGLPMTGYRIALNTGWRVNIGPGALLCIQIIYVLVCCVSLAGATQFYAPQLRIGPIDPYHIAVAATYVAPFALLSVLFVVCRFSFGYALSFYFYTIILGYLWLIGSSQFKYDHALAYASAFASGLAFFLPALFITSPLKARFVLSRRAFARLLLLILILASALIAIGASFNFRLVGIIANLSDARNQLDFPPWLNYGIGITSTALLPFAFAGFVLMGNMWRAAFVLLLLLLFYPITLNRSALLAPLWLPALALTLQFFSARATIILTWMLPVLLGVFLLGLFDVGMISYAKFIAYFSVVNYRMFALTSATLHIYNDFFDTHQLTYFCQINFVKGLIDCPYHQPLALVMRDYLVGNYNASLLATEGIASVGLAFAPFSAGACGLLIALGNRLSSGLPARFILISGSLLLQAFINVPLTIAMVTYGGAILFLLWYLTPRWLFEPPRRND